MATVRWGVLSTASIGRLVIGANVRSAITEFAAVASRDAGRARAFADQVRVPSSYGSYEELLADESLDAVYIPLPVSMHTEWTLAALAAGKHVLCEKPFALSAQDAIRCFDAAAAAGRFCVEGLMYRHHPVTARARELITDGAIGRLTAVRAALTVSVPEDDIRRSPQLGGGALLDLGCYCVSAIRLYGGTPARVYAERVADSGPDAVDLRMAATLTMPEDVLGQFLVGLDLPRRDELELIGTERTVSVPDPWICRIGHVDLRRGEEIERVAADPEGAYGLSHVDDVYRIEFDAVSEAIREDRQLPFGVDDAVEQAAVLEAVKLSSESATPVTIGAGVA